MTALNKAQIKSIVIVPAITGCISAFASITLIVSIFRSNQKLSTVCRRLVFALSAFDVLQSVPQILSSLPMPAGTIWGAIGNDVTCDLQVFIGTIGMCGAILYSLSLTIYFLLVVKFNMSEAKIKKNVEPFLHAVPIVYSLVASTSIYVTNNYNPAGTFCWIAPEPHNCEDDPEVECLSIGNSTFFRWIGAALPVFAVFIGNCVILAVIWCAYHTQLRAYGNMFPLSSQRLQQQQLQSDEEGQTAEESSVRSCCSFCPTIKRCSISMNRSNSQRSTQSTSVLADYLSRPSRTSIRNLKEVSNRAAAYVIAFILAFIFSIINRLIETYWSDDVPFTIILLARFFFPLQGFFNVLVYTYTHVISYRRNHMDCNWFQAFWKVIKSGGDSDQTRSGRASRRRSSIRQMQRVLEQSEYRQRSRQAEVNMSRLLVNR